MDYYRLEIRLRSIFSNERYEGTNSILCASNLEHMNVSALKAITCLAIEIIISKSSDYQNLIKAGNEAINNIEQAQDRNKICQKFLDFNDDIVNK